MAMLRRGNVGVQDEVLLVDCSKPAVEMKKERCTQGATNSVC
jgi:hypothetical protein